MDINDIAAKAAAKIDAARDTKVNAVKRAAASGVEVQQAAQLLAAAEQKYAKDYQAALRADWMALDAYAGKEVSLLLPNIQGTHGVAAGIDETGALLLRDSSSNIVSAYSGGEISLRLRQRR